MTGQNCENCIHYDEYFTKQYTYFSSTKRGYCAKNKHPTNNQEICEKWKDNKKQNETRKRLSLEKLNTAADSIIDVVQLLKEEMKENEKL